MNRLVKMSFVACLVASVLMLSSSVMADEWNKKTVMTFNEPVEIPGMVLNPGTYIFKLFDSVSDRNIVEVTNKEETHVYAIIMAIPDYRMEPTGKTIVNFEERPSGSPEAIESWFYPGDNYGLEFVYPENRAVELAKAANRPVLSMPTELAANITKPTTSKNEPHVLAMEKAPVKAIKPTGESVEIAQAIHTRPLATQMAQANSKSMHAKELPRTASDLPLLALIGVCAVTAGLLVGALSKRLA
jgi:hypothetical protein